MSNNSQKPKKLTFKEYNALSKEDKAKVPWNQIPTTSKVGAFFMLTLMVFFVGTCIHSFNDGPTTPEVTHPVNGPWNGEVRQVEQYLKATLNDAKSYEPVKWYQVLHNSEKGTYEVKHTYRAANAFGAKIMVTDLFVMDAEGNVIEQIRQP